MSRTRDTQRSKLYAAEKRFAKLIGDKQFSDRLGYLRFVEKIERDKWFRRKYGARAFVVKDGRGRTNAAAWGSRHIALPTWARTPAVILHEVAHCVEHTEHESQVPAHGREFAAIFLDLVQHFLGRDAMVRLRQCFREGGVKYKPRRTMASMSPAQRAAFERMRQKSPFTFTGSNRQRDIALARADMC